MHNLFLTDFNSALDIAYIWKFQIKLFYFQPFYRNVHRAANLINSKLIVVC